MNKDTYWNNNGIHEELVDRLKVLVPASGAVMHPRKNKALEKFRKATNCYYDLYNNGLGNRINQFRSVMGFAASPFKQSWRGYGCFDQTLYIKTEQAINEIILEAAKEQKLI